MPDQVAIGYCRVSTDGQGERGYGLEAQQLVIDDEVARRGWIVGETYVDVASGGSLKRRPRLHDALKELTEGRAHILVVSKLDRLSRSLIDFATIMRKAQEEGWGIVAIDIGVDTSSINGELVANIIMALAQWERRIIGKRTKDALAQVKARGVKLGRPVNVDSETVRLIGILRSDGKSYRQIATLLNDQGIPTAQGGREWYASTVRAMSLAA